MKNKFKLYLDHKIEAANDFMAHAAKTKSALQSYIDYLLDQFGYGVSLNYSEWVDYLQLEADHWWDSLNNCEFMFQISAATWRRPIKISIQ